MSDTQIPIPPSENDPPPRDEMGADGSPLPDSKLAKFATGAVRVTLVSGVAIILLSAIATPTMGGTRSARLRWQEHKAECDADAARFADAGGASDAGQAAASTDGAE